jgi:predicted transcriptional regulator
MDNDDSHLLGLTAQIVTSYAASHEASPGQLLKMIKDVHRALKSTEGIVEEAARPVPAAPITKSVFPDYIICLEDGRKLKTLKRHLLTSFDLTPEAYREKWGLPANYPMVAPSYAKVRSGLAKKIGLGRKG